MNNDEHVFDYMAAAEEAGQHLDSLIKQVPGHIKSTLTTAFADEWRKVTAFKELAEATGKLNEAIGEVQESVALLRGTIRAAVVVGAIVSVAIPIVTWLMMNGR